MIKFCHVDHTGASRKYYLAVLKYIQRHPALYGVEVEIISLSEFINKGTPPFTDVLSYQTFPDEWNEKKFNYKTIYQADARFHVFSGTKILVDVHDNGDCDAFTRMYAGRELPRVKCFPSKWFLENYNVILLSTVSANPGVILDNVYRDIEISCKFGKKQRGYYDHTIRESVEQHLQETTYDVDYDWVEGKSKYFEELERTLIVIGAPGWGAHNASYWGAMKAGALLFAHRTLNDIKLFPHSDLIEDVDYVSYDLFNFKAKLRRVINDRKEIDFIRNNGRRKFEMGLNFRKSANQLVDYLKGGGNNEQKFM